MLSLKLYVKKLKSLLKFFSGPIEIVRIVGIFVRMVTSFTTRIKSSQDPI